MSRNPEPCPPAPRGSTRRPPFRPTLEQLEDRLVLGDAVAGLLLPAWCRDHDALDRSAAFRDRPAPHGEGGRPASPRGVSNLLGPARQLREAASARPHHRDNFRETVGDFVSQMLTGRPTGGTNPSSNLGGDSSGYAPIRDQLQRLADLGVGPVGQGLAGFGPPVPAGNRGPAAGASGPFSNLRFAGGDFSAPHPDEAPDSGGTVPGVAPSSVVPPAVPSPATAGPSSASSPASASGPPAETLVAAGSTWKYLDDGSDPSEAWRAPDFEDFSWASGLAQLGYGDGDEATVVGFGPDPNNKHITTYFRHSFEVNDPSLYSSLALEVLRDDGAVVYLNGTELFRSNLPSGAVSYATRASTAVGGADESTFLTARLDPGLLVSGTNVLAVEVHQVNGTSSDLSFDLKLAGSSPQHPVPGRIAVIGDYSAGQPLLDVADLIKSWSPEHIVTVGDNNYPSGSAATIDQNIGQYFHEFISPYAGSYGAGGDTNRFWPALGNHDWDPPAGAQPYLDYFSLPGNERYYDVVLGVVHLFVLDSDSQEPDGITTDSAQAQWLQARLADSATPWRLVVLHHPPYSSGSGGSNPALQWPFQEWGATAVLAGHDHVYERTLVGNLPYFVNGLGGRSIHSFRAPIAGSQVRYNADYGAMLIDADDSSITFQFISRTGSVIDTYTIEAANQAPVLDPIADQTIPAGQDMITVPLLASDPDGDPLTLAASAQSLAYVLDQQLELAFADDYYEDYGGRGEKWVLGAGEQWYFVLPNGELYRWDGTNGQATGALVSTPGASYHADPTLLHDAQPDWPHAALSLVDGTLYIDREDDFVGSLVVTVTVSDGQLTDDKSFTVTVTA